MEARGRFASGMAPLIWQCWCGTVRYEPVVLGLSVIVDWPRIARTCRYAGATGMGPLRWFGFATSELLRISMPVRPPFQSASSTIPARNIAWGRSM